MYSKEELLSKSVTDLVDIANELGLDSTRYASQDDAVYAILDRQAEVEGSKNPLTSSKHKRTRIVRKDTDHVYSVKGKSGENLDSAINKQPAEQSLFKTPVPAAAADEKDINTNQNDTLHVDETSAEAVEKKIEELRMQLEQLPKHRGPRTKQEKELQAEIDQLTAKLSDITESEPQAVPTNNEEKSTEKNEKSAEQSMEDNHEALATEAPAHPAKSAKAPRIPDEELIAKLQAKIKAHNEAINKQREVIADGEIGRAHV